MMETLKLCVSCKGCRRECPTGVDMAQDEDRGHGGARANGAATACTSGWSAGCRATRRPRRARAWLMNLRDRLPGAAALSEALAGFSARRALPRWRSDPFREPASAIGPADGREVVLFADTFNR